MTIATATLGAGEQTEFIRRKNQLTSEQRECLNKIMAEIAHQEVQKGGTGDDAANEIARFIRDTVLTSHPDYCELYQKRLETAAR